MPLSTRRVAVLGLIAGFGLGTVGIAATDSAASLAGLGQPASLDADRSGYPFDGETDGTRAEVVAASSTVRINSTRCDGSRQGLGVLVNGRVLTARHVTAGAQRLDLMLPSGEWIEGVGIDASNQVDLSAIRLPNDVEVWNGPSLSVGSLGDPVVMSQGLAYGLQPKATSILEFRAGIGLLEPPLAMTLDTQAIPGDSGGGVFSSDGTLVGITYAQAFGDLAALVIPAETIEAELPNLRAVALKDC